MYSALYSPKSLLSKLPREKASFYTLKENLMQCDEEFETLHF